MSSRRTADGSTTAAKGGEEDARDLPGKLPFYFSSERCPLAWRGRSVCAADGGAVCECAARVAHSAPRGV